MDFAIPQALEEYYAELETFIETVIEPMVAKDDNQRFFDHRREDARTDWERGGLPSQLWEELLGQARKAADEAGHWRFFCSEEIWREGRLKPVDGCHP